jgi:hypothetical protein
VSGTANSGGNKGPTGSVPGVPFAKGDDPRRGHGLPGKSGRKANVYIELCRSMMDDPDHQEAIRAVMRDKDHPAFGQITKTVWAYGAGVPKQTVLVEGDVPVLQIVRDQAAVVAAVQATAAEDE